MQNKPVVYVDNHGESCRAFNIKQPADWRPVSIGKCRNMMNYVCVLPGERPFLYLPIQYVFMSVAG